MQTLYNHLINEAVGNSSLCVDRLPNRVRTCDYDLSARKLDWIPKLRDHPSGGRMIEIAMYIDDLELLLELLCIGARLFVYDTPYDRPIGPLVTRYLLEVGLIDKSGTDFSTKLVDSLQISCAKHQLFDLLDKQFPKPIDAVTANRLWRACPLPSMQEWLGEFPYVFDIEDIYAEEHLRQGLDHVVDLILKHSVKTINFPRLMLAFLEINDRDSIERLFSSHPKKFSNTLSTAFLNPYYSGFRANIACWSDLSLEDWKWFWDLMDDHQRKHIQGGVIKVRTAAVAEWLLSVDCNRVFIIDPLVDFEWKRDNGIKYELYNIFSCAFLEAIMLVNPPYGVPVYWSRNSSTQILMALKEKGLNMPGIIYLHSEDLDCYTEWFNSHYERTGIGVMCLRSTPLSK